MENTILIQKKEVQLYHASSIFSGYGHQKITVELCYNDEYEKFYATTSNMPDFDEASEIEDYEEKQMALYNLIENQISSEIEEWLENL